MQKGQIQVLIAILIVGLLALGGYLVYQKQSAIKPAPSAQPTTQPSATPGAEGKFCGGFAANLPENQCPPGYKCQLDGNYPDAGGKCVKK